MFYIESFFGMLALITSCIGFIQQVYKSFVIKSASDISMLMLINYFICSISWVIYALYQYSAFVLISNVIGTAVSLISIAQKCYYDKRSV